MANLTIDLDGGSDEYKIGYRPIGTSGPYTYMNPNPKTMPVTISGIAPKSYDLEITGMCGGKASTPILATAIYTPKDPNPYELIYGSDSGIACAGGSDGTVCGPTDLAFVIDTTGSMGSTLENIKTNLNNLATLLVSKTAGNYRLGLVTFADDVTTRVAFGTANIEAFKSAVNGLVATGGSNTPESSDLGIEAVVSGLNGFNIPFRAEAGKIIIMVTDAEPGGSNPTDSYDANDKLNVQRIAGLAEGKGIKISSVLVSAGDRTLSDGTKLTDITKLWADLTGGIFNWDQTSGTGFYTSISEVITNCGSVKNYRTYFCGDFTLAVGSILYSDLAMTTPLSAGYYAADAVNGANVYSVDATGKITAITQCS